MREGGSGAFGNQAITVASDETVSRHGPAPGVHAPPQPPNCDPPAGTAVNVACAPSSNETSQAEPHSIPAVALATCPDPSPIPRMVTRWAGSRAPGGLPTPPQPSAPAT